MSKFITYFNNLNKIEKKIMLIDGWMTSSVDNLQMEPPLVQAVK